jgi:hypothetical protein
VLDVAADMQYAQDAGFYIRKSERSAGKNIPYCPWCWNVDRITTPLNPGAGIGVYQCHIHKSHYETAGYRDQKRRTREILDSRVKSAWS